MQEVASYSDVYVALGTICLCDFAILFSLYHGIVAQTISSDLVPP